MSQTQRAKGPHTSHNMVIDKRIEIVDIGSVKMQEHKRKLLQLNPKSGSLWTEL